MAVAYTIVVPTPAGVSRTIEVHVTAMRHDGKPLTREELEALVAAYPPPTAEGRAAIARVLADLPPTRPATKAGPRAKTAAAKPRRAPAKRAAARRPARTEPKPTR